jgi:hypothetical protein
MRRARWILGILAGSVLAVSVAQPFAGSASRAAGTRDCSELHERTFVADSLTDLRSYSDAMAMVVGVDEEIPPPPPGPEGWAGVIGRKVTVRVEEVLWRRPKAPAPPATFRFSDWGWFGTLENRVPARICGLTRMAIGTRYLAPIARLRGATWYPFSEVRLRLDGAMVVGGVDGGEPNDAHNALSGRPTESAVRMVARARPYRAVVRNPRLSPARRWQAADADRYRVWGGRPRATVTVASGATKIARWELYLRSLGRGRSCLGMRVRPLWDESGTVRRERCRARAIAKGAVTLQTFAPEGMGAFAYGRAGRRVGQVEVRVGDRAPERIGTLPAPRPPGGRDRFWVMHAGSNCTLVSVQSLGWVSGVPEGKRRTGRIGPPGCG